MWTLCIGLPRFEAFHGLPRLHSQCSVDDLAHFEMVEYESDDRRYDILIGADIQYLKGLARDEYGTHGKTVRSKPFRAWYILANDAGEPLTAPPDSTTNVVFRMRLDEWLDHHRCFSGRSLPCWRCQTHVPGLTPIARPRRAVRVKKSLRKRILLDHDQRSETGSTPSREAEEDIVLPESHPLDAGSIRGPPDSDSEEDPEEAVSDDESTKAVSEDESTKAASEEDPEESASDEEPQESASDEEPEEAASEEDPEEAASEEDPEESASDEEPEESASEEEPEESASSEEPKKASSEETALKGAISRMTPTEIQTYLRMLKRMGHVLSYDADAGGAPPVPWDVPEAMEGVRNYLKGLEYL